VQEIAMPGSKTFLAAALVAASSVAHADASFEFAVHGGGDYAAGGYEGCSPDHPEQCVHHVTWTGTLTVVTTSAADGVYDVGHDDGSAWIPGDIVRVTLDSNVGGTDVDGLAPPGNQFFPGQYPYAVTIQDGRITAIEWTSTNFYDPAEANGFLHIDGLDVQFEEGVYHGTYADMNGTLSAIPEPASGMLALAGLAAVAAALRRRGLTRRAARPA
jgi:hypothetical protein